MGMVKIGDSLEMDENRRNQFLAYHKLPKNELVEICRNWTCQDWFDFYTCKGVMSLDEFCQKLLTDDD